MTLTVRDRDNGRNQWTVHVWPANPKFVVGGYLIGPGRAVFRIMSIAEATNG